MKHFKILLLKFVVSIVVFWISIGLFFGATLVEIISFALLVTVVSYLIGDQILLPRIGNRNSVVVDFFLTYLLVWVFGGGLLHSYLMVAWGSIISATLIAGSEVFVHSYILKNVKPVVRENQRSFNQSFAFELAEEQDPDPRKEK
ncbi:YndM family protein [Anaerobacillus isosaccharinicus]|uniref:YndM family protein n=1 Tax=Anaerobacillus isosaccharinicus TaxID=1532552 RepID=A0A1S2KXV9_9BACI|nr:YndM family protein [Anaerobacillus isosaccharinicus]MBA5586725.1 YndM family protein [Anaerobacillus isosaccharinicus]QOY35052.1 YndM family protein [Anaerobacillus isosaccharinicus]